MPNIIYSKKYPKETSAEDNIDTLIENLDCSSVNHGETMAKILKDTTYESLPDREKTSKKFIQLAIEVSMEDDIDVAIWELEASILADIAFDGLRAMGSNLKELIDMADSFEIFLDEGDRDILLELQYYTKAIYRGGQLIHP